MVNEFTLSAPPSRLERGQRVLLEALGVACEIIELEHSNIIEIVREIHEADGLPKGKRLELSLIRAFWSLVDRIDQTRLILLGQRKDIQLRTDPKRDRVFAACRKMRNGMDHLGSNAEKHRRKRKALPIFGMVSFTWNTEGDFVTKEEGEFLSGINATLITMSSLHQKGSLDANLLVDDNVYENFGNIRFFAFDEYLILDDCKDVIQEIREILDKVMQTVGEAKTDEPVTGGKHVILRKSFDRPVEIKRNE